MPSTRLLTELLRYGVYLAGDAAHVCKLLSFWTLHISLQVSSVPVARFAMQVLEGIAIPVDLSDREALVKAANT